MPQASRTSAARLHTTLCAIELGILTHVDGSNESPHDGEHPHPWPCERMAEEGACGCRQWIVSAVADLWGETLERRVCTACHHDYHPDGSCTGRPLR